MEEVLVAAACLYNTGCDKVTAAYISEHKDVQYYLQASEATIKRNAPKVLLTVAPLVAIAAGKPAKAIIHQYIYAEVKSESFSIVFNYGF